MTRIFILVVATLLLHACNRGRDVTVAIHIDGSQVLTQRFHSFEKASEWVSQSCEILWNQAKSNGRSAQFHIVASGSGLAGVVESPKLGFESTDSRSTRLIQFDETYGDSPKIEGEDLQWHSVESYLKYQIMMISVFGTHNQKHIENKP
jgi:hypothetical protein